MTAETLEQEHYPALRSKISGVAILLDSAPRNWTSMEEVNYRLCKRLSSLGITPVLVFAEPLPELIEKRMLEAGAKIEVIMYGKQRQRYLKELERIVRQHKINLTHICFFDYFSFVPWIARLSGLKHIIYEELNSGMMNATSWKRKLLQLRTLVMTWPMTRVIAVSEFVKKDLVKRGITADRIDVRYLAANEERFKPDPFARQRWAEEYSLAPDELMMCSVTLLRPFKSPETLVEASAVLARRNVKARFFVAGDGSMLNDLKAMSEKLGVADRIHWLGFCKNPTSLIQASDVFLLASVGEAGGFVLSEAMGCGTPIIGSKSGVIPECVVDGETGLLAEPKNAESFADAIEKLANEPDLLSAMRTNSRNRMLANFTTDINVSKTLAIYETVVKAG